MSETEKVNSWDGECSLLSDLDMSDKRTESKNGSLIRTRGIFLRTESTFPSSPGHVMGPALPADTSSSDSGQR